MAFDVTGLVDYVDQSSEELLLKAQIQAKTAGLLMKQTGIKSSAAVQLFDTDIIIQDGAGCGYNTSGTTTISQRVIVTGPMKVNEDLCVRDLESKWTQILLNQGQNYEDNPAVIAQAYMEQKVAKLAAALETLDWQGDTGGSDFYDGLITVIDGSGVALDGNTGGVTTTTGITEANIYDIVKGIILTIPYNVSDKEDVRVFMGYDNFNLLVFGLLDENNFHFNTEGGLAQNKYTLTFPGTNITVEGVAGLNGTDRMFAFRTSNGYIGMDAESDSDELRVWYSKDDDVVKHSIRFRRGTQVAFPDEVVEFTLATP